MESLFNHLDANQGRYLQRLQDLARQPSVAAQNLGMRETAAMVAELLKGLGAAVQIVPTSGHPVVVGDLPGRCEKTLSFYNHYDVQPPEPLQLWDSPPWEPTIRDGKLYARGVADNKGDLVARISAVEAYLAVHGQLPCRVKFIVEGEEEIGSPHLQEFVDGHANLIRADGCIWEFGAKDLQERPVISFGLKGICYVELSVQSASSDLHSSWAAVTPNAAWRLTWALASLKGPNERVRIAGFYDAVRAPSAQDVKALKALGFDEAGYREKFGIDAYLKNLTGTKLLKKLYFEPTCTICGIESGYTGEGAKTVSPCLARVKLDFRMVPDQDPRHIVKLLRKHLDEHDFPDVQIKLLSGEKSGRTPLDAPLGKLAVETAQQIYGKKPVVHPLSPGSGPMHTLCQQLGIPSVSTGCSYSGSQAHAPNENIRLADFHQGIKHMALLLDRFAAS